MMAATARRAPGWRHFGNIAAWQSCPVLGFHHPQVRLFTVARSEVLHFGFRELETLFVAVDTPLAAMSATKGKVRTRTRTRTRRATPCS